MKLILTTTYSDVDEEWLSWYLKRLENNPYDKKLTEVAIKLKTEDRAWFCSTDPTSKTYAETTYEIVR